MPLKGKDIKIFVWEQQKKIKILVSQQIFTVYNNTQIIKIRDISRLYATA